MSNKLNRSVWITVLWRHAIRSVQLRVECVQVVCVSFLRCWVWRDAWWPCDYAESLASRSSLRTGGTETALPPSASDSSALIHDIAVWGRHRARWPCDRDVRCVSGKRDRIRHSRRGVRTRPSLTSGQSSCARACASHPVADLRRCCTPEAHRPPENNNSSWRHQ